MTLTQKYKGKDRVDYIFEYHDADSFEDLPKEKCRQAYGIAFHGDKFIIVNNIECDPADYKKYFDWGKIGDRLIERAKDMLNKHKNSWL
jgi:hypothetical protein